MRPMEPSEVLGMFRPSTRAATGLLVWALADRLAALDENELAAFGVVIAGEATGWMGPDEVPRPSSPEDVDRMAKLLLDRLRSAGLWEQELDAPGD